MLAQGNTALLGFSSSFGGAERDRTADPLLAKQVLSQLSYSPSLNGTLRTKAGRQVDQTDRKSTRLNSSHLVISYAVFCLKKKNPQSHDVPHKCRDCTHQLRVAITHAQRSSRRVDLLHDLDHCVRAYRH